MFFELDDIKRRHSYTFDVHNAFSWIDTPDNKFIWNWQRGAMTGIIASAVNEVSILFTENWRLMTKEYEWPKNAKQYGIFTREVLRMDNFKGALKNRLQYAFCIGTFDIGSRLAFWRQWNAGWYRTFGSVEINHFRKWPPSIMAALVSCWVSTPFEMARLAYYADKTFPKELQQNYKSYFNALRRIPFEEGPYFLFKNSFPFMMRNFIQTLTMFYTYDWMKDKIGAATHRISDFPLPIVKGLIGGLSVYLACVFSYPFGVMIREMVEYWPKEKDGTSTWQGNYRRAAVWLWYHEYGSNFLPGFVTQYFTRNAPWMLLTLWISDRLGMFNYWQHDYFMGAGTNSWEDAFS